MTYEEVRMQRIAEAKAEGDRYRALAEREDRDVNPNWFLAEDEEVRKAVRAAARGVNQKYESFWDLEDLVSEGLLLVATKDDLIRPALDGDMALVRYGVYRDLERLVQAKKRRATAGREDFDHGAPEGSEQRLFDRAGDLRGGSGIEWTDDCAAVL